MLLTVKDGEGNNITIIAQAQATLTDRSGLIAGEEAQTAFQANGSRSGWFFQNLGLNPMFVNEIGVDATSSAETGNGSIMVAPGASFPPPGYPVTTTQISVKGTPGDPFIGREW